MKLKNKVIIDAVPALNSLSETKLPVKTSYIVAKNISELSKLLEDINKIKDGIIDKWMEKDKNGNPIKSGEQEGSFKLKKDNKYHKEMEELFEIENEVKITKVKLDDLGDIDISPGTLISLDWMIEEDEK